MDQFIVEGGVPLSGEILPAGNKNEALPVLAAVLLTDEPVILRNVPNITDIDDMRRLLQSLGVQLTQLGKHAFQFQAQTISTDKPPVEMASKIRGSFLLVAPLLARCGSARVPAPGGDKIGLRPVDTHLQAFHSLNVEFEITEESGYHFKTNGLKGAMIHLDEASVMATENAIMAAVLAKGTTTIYNAACEPHVQGLCRLLVQMGAKIEGIGSNLITIQGVKKLHGTEYTLQSDHTEVGSFIGLAAVTGGELLIRNAGIEHLRVIRMAFEKLGVSTLAQGEDLFVPKQQKLEIGFPWRVGIPKIDSSTWPGFPADLTSIMVVVATQCHGTLLIFEKLFESRLFWVDKLISMGAKIVLCDPHRVVVSGPVRLQGVPLFSPDIRAGMALLIAALCAEGTSVIHNIHQIDRGYEQIDERLKPLGARIQRV